MLAVKSVKCRDNFKEWCDKISMGETVVISRPRNENIYMINEAEYNALQKAKRNAEYLAMLDESVAQFERGETISFYAGRITSNGSRGLETHRKDTGIWEKAWNTKVRLKSMADFTFTEKAMEQYIYWQTQDKKTLKKINHLITDIGAKRNNEGCRKAGTAKAR